jgi:hypothetical protein
VCAERDTGRSLESLDSHDTSVNGMAPAGDLLISGVERLISLA